MELDDVDGIDGKLKVWIRRVWTLEMVSTFSPVAALPMAQVLLLTKYDILERYRATMMLRIWVVGLDWKSVHGSALLRDKYPSASRHERECSASVLGGLKSIK